MTNAAPDPESPRLLLECGANGPAFTSGKRRRWTRRLGLAAAGLGAIVAAYSVQRWGLHNFHVAVPGRVYRCSQPGETQLRQWKQDYGLKTVLNLRSDDYNALVKEEAGVVQRLGMKYIHLPMIVNRLPKSIELTRLIETIETADRPLLVHCQAGADRTGLACMIAAMAVGGQDYRQAREQISIWYLSFRFSDSHVTAVAEKYEDYCAARGIGTGGWPQFRDWAMNIYLSPKEPIPSTSTQP